MIADRCWGGTAESGFSMSEAWSCCRAGRRGRWRAVEEPGEQVTVSGVDLDAAEAHGGGGFGAPSDEDAGQADRKPWE
jgi:hypothetical protein